MAKEATNKRSFCFSTGADPFNKLYLLVWKDATNRSEPIDTIHTLITNTFYLVGVSYKYITDGTSEARFYVDGKAGSVSTNAMGPVIYFDNALWLGDREIATQPLYGTMSSARLYNQPRYAAQILQDAIDARRN